jgi:hypothetical protein
MRSRFKQVSRAEAKRILEAWGAYMSREQREHFEAIFEGRHVHANVYFRTPSEHDRALADGAIRCMTQLIERTHGRDPALGFRHVLSALLEGMADLRKEMDP